jgi:succinate dehydrogenase/fumarate reductase flavoprotein subunit
VSGTGGSRYDVAVVGGGLAGVVAAVRAAECGASVVLVECGARLGGTALHSGGGFHIFGVETWDEYVRLCPHAPEHLARPFVENFHRCVDWLLSTGAPGRYGTSTTRGLTMVSYRVGEVHVPGRKQRWFRFMGERLRAQGGTVMTGTRATELTLEDGGVRLRALGTEGERDLRARTVILAAGGFQSSPELLREHFGPAADAFITRAVRHDVGDGLHLARSVGAAATESMDTLYGHLMPAPPCRISWANYVDPGLLSAFYANEGIVLNVHGERFVDEGVGELNGETINAAARQSSGGLWVVFDEAIRRTYVRFDLPRSAIERANLRYLWLLRYVRPRWERGRPVFVLDKLRYARARGALVLEAATVEELGTKLAADGVDGESATRTIAEYNEHVSGGAAPGLAVPRSQDAHALQTPPFYAIKVAVGVSMTYGGVAIDEHARALDEAGRPIAGVYAVPGTAGGVHHLHYGGALAACGVFGMIAGEEAAGHAARRAVATVRS